MALMIVNPAMSNPGVTLVQALNDYETILSDEDKIQLRSQGAPNAMVALNLATTIDAQNTSHRRQCMGPRLITFLESVEQFSSIVDTIVSSHPDIAALVWGGLKLTLLAANNITSYFDKLSTLFMKLGRTCPRFTEFSYLYSTSVRLQKALCEYYAAVVRLCKHSTIFCGKPGCKWFSKALLSPFESEFGPYERELDRLAQDVRDEISLASSQVQIRETQLQARERQEAKADRWISKRFMKTNLRDQEDARNWRLAIDRQNSEKHRLRVLDSFSTYDHQRAYKQARRECVVGTSNWICETLEFKSWMVEPRETLWCHGRLGSGKTILTACVVAYIAEKVSPKDVISFFFCRYDDLESLEARTIFGSIARQLINDQPTEAFHKFQSHTADTTAILNFLKTVLTGKRRYFIVLDGLDECEEEQSKALVNILRELLDTPLLHIKLYLTTRTSVMNWVPLKLQPERHIVLDTAENQASVTRDIDNFVNASLQERLQENELQLGDPTLVLKIQDALKTGAQGMFLWVHFQLRTICAQKSDANIIAALDNLPRDLPQTFERILSGIIETDDIDRCKRIFQWVAAAKRPLTLEELREAIGIEPLQQEWDSSRFVNDMSQAIANCGNLLFIEEEHQAVHFTHYSVKQYLLSEAISTSLQPYHIDLERANAEVGAVCVTYLDFGIFSRQVARTTGNGQSITSIPSMVLKETLPHRTLGNKIALALLQRQYNSGSAVSRPLEEALGDTEAFRRQRIQEQYFFSSYAREFWLEHTNSATELIIQIPGRLWSNLINDANLPGPSTSIPWTYADWMNGTKTVIDWIIRRKHHFLAQLMVHSHVDPPEEALQYLLHCAVHLAMAMGDKRLFEMILNSGRVSKSVFGPALVLVADRGGLGLLEQLISLKADINVSVGDDGRTALQAAAQEGHVEVLELLLAEGADINASAGNNRGRTALQAAVEQGHVDIVEKLLIQGADINASAGHDRGRTALQAAAERGHMELVEKLSAKGANINASAGYSMGRTALQAATEQGHTKIIERLLAKGADINALGCKFNGRTALQAAAEQGHMEVVETFIAEGADVNAPASDHWGRTALQAAAGRHLEIVETLLAKGADINAPAGKYWGRTALQAAAEGGRIKVVEKLLAAGADVNAPRSESAGKTALQAAKDRGHTRIVLLLRKKGAKY